MLSIKLVACSIVVEALLTMPDDTQLYSDSMKINVVELVIEDESAISENLPAPGLLSVIIVTLVAALFRRID